MGNRMSGSTKRTRRADSTRISQRSCDRASLNSGPWSGQRRQRLSSSVAVAQRNWSFADDAPLAAKAEPLAQPRTGGWGSRRSQTGQSEEETVSTGPLSLSTRLEYASLKAGEAYNVFSLVSLRAVDLPEPDDKPGAKEERSPVDITCALDVSGSMNCDNKIQLVKDAVMFIVDQMFPSDRLSIVTFCHEAERTTGLMCMDAAGKEAAREAVQRLSAGGGTSIAAGLDCAIANMEQRRHRNPVSAVFLLSDGQDGTTGSQVQELVGRARAAQCSLYAFGFGSDHDAQLLSSFAEAAQTPFTFVEQLDAIRGAFAGALSGLMSIVAQHIDLTIAPAGGCTVAAVHTSFSQRRPAGDRGSVIVTIPDAFAGERRDVVIELRVPAAQEPTVLFEVSAQYLAGRGRVPVNIPAVLLEAPRSAEPEGEPDIEVFAQRQRVEVTSALEQAIAHGEAGHFEEAQALLSTNAARLRASPMKTPVTEALLGELDDAYHRASSSVAWESGGQAEIADAMNMHKWQRCTNTAGPATKTSKAMYSTCHQKRGIAESCKR